MVVSHLLANVASAKKILAGALPLIPLRADWHEHSALEHAIVTGKDHWNPDTAGKLRPLLERFLSKPA